MVWTEPLDLDLGFGLRLCTSFSDSVDWRSQTMHSTDVVGIIAIASKEMRNRHRAKESGKVSNVKYGIVLLQQ